MNTDHQWNLPTKRKGTSLKSTHQKFDPNFAKALDILGASETARIGRLVSRGTILTDLSTKDTAFHRQQRAELRRTYLQLKRGKQNESNTIHESTNDQA